MQQSIPPECSVAVIGLGAAGSAALWALSRLGIAAIGLEQFELGHDRGSSHGQTRLLRVAYAEGAHYVPMVRRAICLWRELEQESASTIFHQTGVFYSGYAGSKLISSSLKSASRHNVTCNEFTPQLTIPSGWNSFLEEEGGFIDSDLALKSFIQCAERRSSRAYPGICVTKIDEYQHRVIVTHDLGTLHCDKVIVTAGGWSGQLVPSLAKHLSIERRVLFWFDDKAARYSFASGFKPFIVDLPSGSALYGFPSLSERGVKIAEHMTGVASTTLAQLDRTVSDSERLRIRELAATYLPGLVGPTDDKVCFYPMTPDDHFILDRAGKFGRIIVGAGFCGHGFKFAPMLGESLACLATDREPPVDTGFLSLKRFE